MNDTVIVNKTQAMGPTIITQKPITTKTLEDVLATESGYIEMLTEPQILFDDYQREFLECLDRFQIWLKGRQLGFSFVSAARALMEQQNIMQTVRKNTETSFLYLHILAYLRSLLSLSILSSFLSSLV